MTACPKPKTKCRECGKNLKEGSLKKYCDMKCRKKHASKASKIPVKGISGRFSYVGKAQAKERAWKAFSRFIRLRDKDNGCITCGKWYPWQNMQAGHAIQGRGNSILFDEELVNGQCKRCNIFMRGMYPQYALVLIRKHGIDWWDNKLKLKQETKDYSIQDYLDIESLYQQKAKDLDV